MVIKNYINLHVAKRIGHLELSWRIYGVWLVMKWTEVRYIVYPKIYAGGSRFVIFAVQVLVKYQLPSPKSPRVSPVPVDQTCQTWVNTFLESLKNNHLTQQNKVKQTCFHILWSILYFILAKWELCICRMFIMVVYWKLNMDSLCDIMVNTLIGRLSLHTNCYANYCCEHIICGLHTWNV